MTTRRRFTWCLAVACSFIGTWGTWAIGAEPDKTSERSVELFAAMKSGEIDAELIAPSSKQIYLRVTNNTTEMLKIELPDAFAGVPVLAQFGPGNPGGQLGLGQLGQLGLGQPGLGQPGLGQPGLGQGAQGGASQALGGGFNGANGINGGLNQGINGQFNGGLNGLNGGFNPGLNGGLNRGGNPFGNGLRFGNGNGMFRVPAGRTGKVSAPAVCLEYGKTEPVSRMKYRIVPLDDYSSDKSVHELCKMLGSGRMSQSVAQAAAWHLCNGLDWETLASLDRVQSKYTGNQKMFRTDELQAARQIVHEIHSDKPLTASKNVYESSSGTKE